jgi:hypothetical protein
MLCHTDHPDNLMFSQPLTKMNLAATYLSPEDLGYPIPP